MFTFEDRTCACGETFNALAMWPDDTPCVDCGRRDYDERIAAINATKPYRIESIGGACPTQAEGEWVDGQRFYFRARHGSWALYIDPTDPIGKWDTDLRGDDPSNGFMDDADVLAILDAALAPSPAPNPTETGE